MSADNEMENLPYSWSKATTGELFTYVTSGSRGWAQYYSDTGAKFLRVGNLDHGSISLDLNAVQYIKPPDNAEGHRTRVHPGDVLISITADVGMIGLAPTNLGEAYINQHVCLARPVDGIQRSYLAWFLASDEGGQRQFRNLQRGATKAGLGLDDVRAIRAPIAPLPEQLRIVSEIEKQFTRLDAAEASLRRAQAKLKRQRAAVLKAACEGSLLTTKGRWTEYAVEEIGTVQLGRQRSPKNVSSRYPTPYIRAANITEQGLDFSSILDMEFTPAERSRYELYSGDIVLSEASGSPDQVGKPAIWRGQITGCCFQNTVIRLRPKLASSEFLLLVFRHYYLNRVFATIAAGVGINHLSAQKFSRIKVSVPPLHEQHQIVAEVDRRLSAIEALESQVEKDLLRSKKLRQSILKRAFEGKLVPQDPSDEPASVLLDRIRNLAPPPKKTRV